MSDSVILIDKPAGMSSFGVVARIKRVLSEQEAGKPSVVLNKRRRVKVGHTGTLDPFATGLMIIVTGKECKNAGNYSKLDKVYEATIRLGQTSTTGDPEGELTDVSKSVPSNDDVEKALTKFVGEITQVPPIYSAIKIDGQRAYKLARAGKEFEVPARKVQIFSLDLINYSYPNLKIRTHVSSGTYIRTLAADIGGVLGVGAYCVELRRTKIAKWDVADAKKLSDFGIDS
ncbi:MAG TPA: tRNA pseudouridine(55) synthase TruB [Candidatus Saccharibacteria bacterium]|nr:tRNA pseudouridine(55) synthase TruB [Candidatus Saccharibacteria bacterium]